MLLCPEDRLLPLPQTISFKGVESVDAWVVVQGLKDGVEVLSYERRATLSTDVIEQVTMVVDASCIGVRCVLGQTCVKGACEIVSDQAPAGACDSATVIVLDPEEPMPAEEEPEEEEPEEMEGPKYCPAPPTMQEGTDV